MHKVKLAFLFMVVGMFACLPSVRAGAQAASNQSSFGSWIAAYQARVTATQNEQPHWITPLVTVTPRLEQEFRTDFVHYYNTSGHEIWNYDNSKGVNVIIPHMNTEFVLDLPPYIQHNNPKVNDGAGDFSILGKYRLASGNAQHGAYTLSFWTLVTFPTGSYKNGSPNASFQPNLGGGKGFGNFDFQTSIGATLPAGNPAIHSSGRPVLWNVAAQYKIGKLFWPEIESNATFYHGGTNDGKIQEFITPGIVIGKCALHPNDPKKRPGLAFGGGMQIATSQIHTYNHELILTARWIY